MMAEHSTINPLEYPFDSEFILRKKKSIKRQLLGTGKTFISKKIAILGGSTTSDLVTVLDLFLLNAGIKAEFYESEYNKYWEDVMFNNVSLMTFHPDIIWIHTTNRNISNYPPLNTPLEEIKNNLEEEYAHFEQMWDKISECFGCIVVQNNFEPPFYRFLGNKDSIDPHGKLYYINKLNERFYEYARTHENFYINDINYLSSCYGIQRWSDPFYWHMYKYALCVSAIPELAYNTALIIKSILGKNKKAIALDLDNTLWGGIIGEDGAENIEIGQETSKAQIYTEFQQYIKAHKELGVLLTINSKNDIENALAGLDRPDSILKKDDFVSIKANWLPKDKNLLDMAQDLNIGVDSFVFIDDNPAERHIVRQNIPDIAVPEIGSPENYINILDRSGFFEVTALSDDDKKRTEMYIANVKRGEQKARYTNYKDYLISLEMQAEIKPFSPIYMSRIAQLTNKSNQFNLTTLRCTQSDIELFASDSNYITLYGKLDDKFGDNGVVTVVSGHIKEDALHIDLWLMSCRVLKRNMEQAMLDELVAQCLQKKLRYIIGYYYPTAKNSMVKEFYKEMGFELHSKDNIGNTSWILDLKQYVPLNDVIQIKH